MSIVLNSSATNNADWKTQFQFTDADTGALVDFTGATIEIEVRDYDGCLQVEATTTNGLITIISTGIFELDVPATTMETLCPGMYQVGGVYSLNGETISLFTGTINITSGVAQL